MQSRKHQYNYQRVFRQISIGFGASLCLLAIAQNTNINPVKANSIEIAQAASVCESSGGSQFVSAETKNYLVYICGGDNPNTYVGMAKNGGNSISLPLQTYSRDRFVAVNGDTRYTLTRAELIVTKNGRVIARERAQWKR
ncbi:hypothetical protein IQ264_22135 [Phormidium sp. LEGE 05292]|uniref:hypothetical protein n=1 Tax=[Phormidium] sp. LEGE 05292 TaxID=767427 RepID=UPI00187EAEA4|nr:hypothetical protein [Phormidium sp. LEGE 05292]MBE9228125.1 hypothetical protein [Phormidium sp. LEGE 05292]